MSTRCLMIRGIGNSSKPPWSMAIRALTPGETVDSSPPGGDTQDNLACPIRRHSMARRYAVTLDAWRRQTKNIRQALATGQTSVSPNGSEAI